MTIVAWNDSVYITLELCQIVLYFPLLNEKIKPLEDFWTKYDFQDGGQELQTIVAWNQSVLITFDRSI